MKRVGDRQDPIWKTFIENREPLDESWQIPAGIAAGAVGLGAISDIKTLHSGDEESKTRKGKRKDKKPDADKDGVPDWADKKHGKDDHTGKDLEHN